VAVSSRDRALDRLNRQVAELAEMLALERGQAEELRGGLSRITEELSAAATARDAAQRSLAQTREERDRLATDRDGTRAERDRLAARLADLGLTGRGNEERVAALERQLGEALARAEAASGDAARIARDLTEARRGLAEAAELLTQHVTIVGVVAHSGSSSAKGISSGWYQLRYQLKNRRRHSLRGWLGRAPRPVGRSPRAFP
jgi:chemotaxis protein MotB